MEGVGAGCTSDNKSSYKEGNIWPSCKASGGDDIGLILYISLCTKPVLGF